MQLKKKHLQSYGIRGSVWHKRLGDMSEKGMQILARKELVPEVKGTLLKTCVHCLAGKQHRVSFKRTPAYRKSNVLDLVHSNVCGPMTLRTLGGACYFVTCNVIVLLVLMIVPEKCGLML